MDDAESAAYDNIHRTDYLAPYETPAHCAGTFFDLALRPRTSLDGSWHFAIDPYDTCLRARWFAEEYADSDGRPYPVDFSFDDWEQVSVPSCWNVQRDEWYWYEGSAVYVRNFAASVLTGERQFLSFGAAAYAAYVFLNGEYLGWHQGASTPFRVEVTGKLKTDNRLVIVVNNRRSPQRVPMDNTDWFNYGGLHRSVDLVSVPATFIDRVSVALRPDGTFRHIDITLGVNGTQTSGDAAISIPELSFEATLPVTAGEVTGGFDLAPQLWSPAEPKLYDVYVRFGADEWHDRVGFREVRVVGTDIVLNGLPIYLAGVCQHEESVTNGRTLTEAEIRENLRLAKELGCVYMRLAHYPHNELTARIADEVGMLLWEEVPVYWAIDFASPATFADADNQLRELILRDRNRASVIIWSVGNENADTDERLGFMSGLVASCRELDSTRLVSAACLVDTSIPAIVDRLADRLDVIGINEYYGWYEPDFSRLPSVFANSELIKPVIVCEFGADAVAGRRGPADEMFTEDNQLAIYRLQRAVLSTIPYVKGTSPWILYDFRCPRRANVAQGYYNRKGLLSADKTHRKLAFSEVADWYGHLPTLV